VTRKINHGMIRSFTNQISSLLKKDIDTFFKNVTIPNKNPNQPPIPIVQRDDVAEHGRRATK
jgi:hypothetical protein